MTEAESVFWNNSCVGLLSPQPCVPPKARQTVAVGLLSLRALQGYTSSSSFFFLFLRSKLKMEDIKEVNKALKVLDCCRY